MIPFLLRGGHKSKLVENCWPGPSAESCRGFLLYRFWRILPGIFLEDFSVHFFPHINEEIKSGDKIREEIRRNKNENPRKIRSAKNLARPSVSLSKCPFRENNFMCTGESPRNFPSRPHENDTCAVTPCTAIQGQNKCHFSEGPLRAPLWAMECAKGTRRKMTTRK